MSKHRVHYLQLRSGKVGLVTFIWMTGQHYIAHLTVTSSKVSARDVPRKEKEKMGMGKKLERTLFFPFPVLHFLTICFRYFWRKSSKTGEKSDGTAEKG